MGPTTLSCNNNNKLLCVADFCHEMSTTCRDATQCSPAEIHRRFGTPYFRYLQGRRISQERNEQEAGAFRGFLLALHTNPECGDSTFRRNVCELLSDYMELPPRRQYSSPSLLSQSQIKYSTTKVQLKTVEIKVTKISICIRNKRASRS
jgi:hypothetical protein